MSQYDDDEQERPAHDDNLAALRAQASKAAKLERENVMLKAGVDVSTPLGAMFAEAGYQGELTEEAVKAAWQALSPPMTSDALPAPVPQALSEPAPQQGAVPQPRMNEDQLRGGIATTPYEPPAAPEVDPVKEAWNTYHSDIAAGANKDDAAGAVIGSIMTAAAGGDERYLFKGWTDEEMASKRTNRT